MIKFGTGGWRAIIGEDFTKSNIQKLSKALAVKMVNEGVAENGFVLGYDKRFLSREAMKWTAEIFAAEGITTYLVNRPSPTSLIMYFIMKHKLHYGMMITASHNPTVYNGIKVFTYGGRDADEIQTRDIENYVSDVKEEEIAGMEYEKAVDTRLIIEINPYNEYLDSIIHSIDIQAVRNRGLRVALDPMYGVSETSLKTILLTAGCEVSTIHDRHDTLFGGKLPFPSAQALKSLKNYVSDHHMDIGIATDGDADRIGVVDDTGRFLHPNDLLVVLYYYLVKYKGRRGAVVRNIATTHMLDKVAGSFGEKCYEVPVGFRYVSAKMQETNAVIGGESSGGLTVRGHINGKDGIYAAALLIEMIAVTGKSLSRIVREIGQECGTVCMEERDYILSREKKERIFQILLTDKCLPAIPFEADKISYLDGCKIYLKSGGWIIARFSGTEPLLRIFCEMREASEAVLLCDLFEDFLGLNHKQAVQTSLR